MIDQFDERLASWVKEVVSRVNISFAAPTDGDEDLAVNLYLLEIADDPLRHSTGHPPIQPILRYLVTTSAGEPKVAHDLLGRLFYAARKQPDFDVELEPVSSQLWTAFGIVPRPAFILCLDLPPDWSEPELDKTPRVTQGVAPVAGRLVPLYGLVLGPNDTPLASARVEMIALWERRDNLDHLQEVPFTTNYTQLEREAYTGPKGHFTLPGIQAAPSFKTILVRARGREQIFIVKETGAPDAPVEFRLKFEPAEWSEPKTDRTPQVTRDFSPAGDLVALYGLVLDRNNTPLASARVEMIALWELPKDPSHLQGVPFTTNYTQLDRVAYSGPKGQFTLPGIRATPALKTILVSAHGQEQIFIIQKTGAPDAPVVFRLKLEPE